MAEITPEEQLKAEQEIEERKERQRQNQPRQVTRRVRREVSILQRWMGLRPQTAEEQKFNQQTAQGLKQRQVEPRENEQEENPEQPEKQEEKSQNQEKNPEVDSASKAEGPEVAGEGAGELGAEAGAEAAAGAGAEAGAAGAAAGGAAAGEGTAVAGAAAGSGLAVFAGPALAIVGIIVLIFLLVLFILVVMLAKCNEDTWSGTGARALSTVSSFLGIIPSDVCAQLTIDKNVQTVTQKAPISGWEPADLVPLAGVLVDTSASDPRVRQCMLPKVQEVVGNAQKAGLNVTITSAFRKGGFPSRHAFGEAVDIALRPIPARPLSPDAQAKISTLVKIAKAAGFNPPPGDTIDEYNNPTENTTGGHVHIEFNKIDVNGSFCAPYPNPPAPS